MRPSNRCRGVRPIRAHAGAGGHADASPLRPETWTLNPCPADPKPLPKRRNNAYSITAVPNASRSNSDRSRLFPVNQ